MFTFGSSDSGRLGRGQGDTRSAPAEVTRFVAANQQDNIPDVKIGYVSDSISLSLTLSPYLSLLHTCFPFSHS